MMWTAKPSNQAPHYHGKQLWTALRPHRCELVGRGGKPIYPKRRLKSEVFAGKVGIPWKAVRTVSYCKRCCRRKDSWNQSRCGCRYLVGQVPVRILGRFYSPYGEWYCFAVIFVLRQVILPSAVLRANKLSLLRQQKYHYAVRHNITLCVAQNITT